MSGRGPDLFKDKEHLLRMAGIFALGIALFVIMRIAFVPATFGQLGHFRAAAIGEVANKTPISFAGQPACAECHPDVLQTKKDGKHATVRCEACHGALAKHAADPSKFKPVKPDTTRLCPVCHEANSARPKWFKQLDTAEHSGGEACNSCHTPHSPAISSEPTTPEASTPTDSAGTNGPAESGR